MINPSKVFSFEVEAAGDGFHTRWTIPGELPYFEGHFPGNPILPAIAVMDATVEALKRALQNADLDPVAFPSAKFYAVIAPNTEIHIELSKTSDREWLANWSTGDGESKRRLAELRVRL